MSAQLMWTLIIIVVVTFQSILIHFHLDKIERLLQNRYDQRNR